MAFPTELYPNSPDLGKIGGSGWMRDILSRFFMPELQTEVGNRNVISKAFMSQTLQPGALYGAASDAAKGTARQLFAPGGEVSTMIAGARGKAIGQGFAPSAASGWERGILGQATNRVADTFATQAGQLESQRFGALTSAFGQGDTNIQSLLESLFTGNASADQLKLAQKNSSKVLGGFFG